MKYLATFYSHYQALVYKKKLLNNGIEGQLKSVPRTLSSSCGTCCIYDSESPLKEGVEALYKENDGKWRNINE